MQKEMNDQLSDDEATRRMNDAVRRALSTPHKPHAPLKPGKAKTKRLSSGKRRAKKPGKS